MTAYKAVIFDIDGTAIANKLEAMPSELLIRTIGVARNQLHLIAATGRTLQHSLPILRALGLTDPCVIAGGSTVIDPVTGKILYEAAFTQIQLDAISKVCQQYPYQIRAGDQAFGDSATTKDRPLVAPATILFMTGVIETEVPSIIRQLNNIPGVWATGAVSYAGGYVLNVTTLDGTKEHGISRVLKMLNVQKIEAIGVGDGDNDVHLFAAVGHSIAMGNASERLKSRADEIAPTVTDDGLAWAIDHYATHSTVRIS